MSQEYYVRKDGAKNGPYTMFQLRQMWATGSLNLDDDWSARGDIKWRPMENLLDELEAGGNRTVSAERTTIGFQNNIRPVSLTAYQLIAFFFGATGLHKIYARHYRTGIIQFIVVVFLCWTIVIPLFCMLSAWIDVFKVREDALGIPME